MAASGTTPASRASPSRQDMVLLLAGTFRMGSASFYPEERPIRDVAVETFWIDRYPVTVAQFRRFVKATGYLTVAERPLDPGQYPDADPALLVPGSLVFHETTGPVDLEDVSAWWSYVPGARWHRPEGPGSATYERAHHPVVHVAYEDARAYADWAGKALPTEAEWEYAARGGLDGAVFSWGDEIMPGGRPAANWWQGEFPWQNVGLDGWEGTSPVGVFPPNGYGLYDTCGNVWEWTSDLSTPYHTGTRSPCCIDRVEPGAHIPRRIIKGGSHLCAPNYCLRFRPAARQAEAVDTSTSHIGFRCVDRTGC